MNEQFTNKTDLENEVIAQKLDQVAEQTHPNSQFAMELEEQLRNKHKPAPGWLIAMTQISPTLRWVTLMVLLGLVLSWSIKNLLPIQQTGSSAAPTKFVCPVTQPNGSTPLNENPSPYFLGNGQLWTELWPDGKIYMLATDRMSDGWFSMKWGFWRGVKGALTVEGHRLDADALPLRVDIPGGYGDTGFQVLGLFFPTTGCWEVTGHVGDASLTFVTEVVFGVATPTPNPAIIAVTATPIATTETNSSGYDFRGAKLYLAQSLPASPDKAHIYLLKKDTPATQEQAQALANQFGIQGEIYTASLLMYGHTDYVFSDGKQELEVYSNRYFSYVADLAKSRQNPYGVQSSDHAEATIHEFLKARGLDFAFSMSTSDFPGQYILKPLAPDSIPMQYESFTPPVMRVGLDENGEVLSIDASLMDYDQAPVGEYGIISAQEALQILLDDHVVVGKMEYVHSSNVLPKEWYRSYPDNQPVTVYGYLTLNPALVSSKPALILLDGVALTGNISGLESLDNNTFIQATGQYIVENGIRKFNVESWDRKVQQQDLSGTLSRQGDQIIFTSDDGKQYPLIDPPADLPLDTTGSNSQLSVGGVILAGNISWTYIQFWEDYSGGGGGGGGGLGFYQLNLSGTPVPFPSPTPQVATNNQSLGVYTIAAGDTLSALSQKFGTTVDELMRLNNLTDSNIYVGQSLNVPMPEPVEQAVQDLRGYLSVSIHNKSDGTSSKEYQLEVAQNTGGSSVYTMEGSVLSELDEYNALPILVTGTIDKTGKLIVDSYKIPYPGLHFQVLKGTQKTEQVNGQNVVVFTTQGGNSYVEFLATNNFPNDTSFTGIQGDLIQQEVLIIPDEAFGGLPVAHIYQSSIIQDNGPEMEVQANQIRVFNSDNDPTAPSNYTQPNLTIDQVELTYFASNPYYQVNDPNYSQRSPYIQPVWHFHGHYDDGSEFDVLIQALKQDFLLPEVVPGSSPG